MRFQVSDLSLQNPSGLTYLQSFPKGMPVSSKSAFSQLGSYVIQSITDEKGPAADARIPVARVVDKANKARSTLDLAPLFGELRAVAKSYSAAKTDAEIVRSASWFYENVEKPARAKTASTTRVTDTELMSLPPEDNKSKGPLGWIKEHPLLTAGIGAGIVVIGVGVGIWYTDSQAAAEARAAGRVRL